MQEQFAHIKYEFNGRKYEFICQPDSPTNEVKEILFQLMKYVGAIEDAAKAQQNPIVEEELKKENE